MQQYEHFIFFPHFMEIQWSLLTSVIKRPSSSAYHQLPVPAFVTLSLYFSILKKVGYNRHVREARYLLSPLFLLCFYFNKWHDMELYNVPRSLYLSLRCWKTIDLKYALPLSSSIHLMGFLAWYKFIRLCWKKRGTADDNPFYPGKLSRCAKWKLKPCQKKGNNF